MKKSIIKISIIACLMLLPMLTSQMFAQAPPAPPTNSGGSANHGSISDQPDPNGAPLDGGLSILLLMGAAYGGKKIQGMRKK